MANFSDKADEVVGTAEKATAQVKQGVDAAVDKAEEVVGDVKESATDTAEQLHLDDRRVLVVAAIAGITLTVLVRKFRGNRGESRGKTVTKRAAKRATKRAAKTGLARALSN